MNELALFGGEKVKNTPFGTGKRFGEEELSELKEAIEQGTLFYWSGSKVKKFNEEFSKMYSVPYCIAVTSGTAAVHVALGTLGVGPGDEVITTPITDMGTLIGILYQNAIPVFADLDPHTYNMTPESIESRITDKTKAIIVVHLAGNPADMDPILEIAKKHNIKVIEDCAQSYLAYYKGKLVGTMGDIGCFSLNEQKHISCGDGGMCLVHDEETYKRALRFADKNYNRFSKDISVLREVPFLAPNYRMTELQGAVALAQLRKLNWICERRTNYGEAITKGISGLKGIYPHQVIEGAKSSYWFYLFRINEEEANVSRKEFSEALAAEGIPNYLGYIPSCVYEYELFTKNGAYEGTDCPFGCEKYSSGKTKYYKGLCPSAESILETSIRLAVSEFYTDKDIEDIISAIRKVSNHYSGSLS